MINASDVMKLTAAVASMLVCIVLASCGGGGGGGGTSSKQVILPDDLTFSLASSLEANPFTITPTSGSRNYTIILFNPQGPLSGAYNLKTGSCTVNKDNSIRISTDLWSSSMQTLNIGITSPITGTGNNAPVEGGMTISDGSNTITLTVTSSPSPGVTISNGGDSEFFTWVQFNNLIDSAFPIWQQEASLAMASIYWALSQVITTADSIVLIEDNRTSLQKSRLVDFTGDEFQGVLPPVITPPAKETVQWTDTHMNGSLDPGDAFSLTFSGLWERDAALNIDSLLNGPLQMEGFMENREDRSGSTYITSVGFDRVSYQGLSIYAVDDTNPGTYTIDPDVYIILSGGFSIGFSEQAP